MTHDELLLDVSEVLNWYEDQERFAEVVPYLLALQKVVELHKPKYWENIYDPSWNGNDCSICFTDGNLDVPSSKITYPCPTIQAIEKELS